MVLEIMTMVTYPLGGMTVPISTGNKRVTSIMHGAPLGGRVPLVLVGVAARETARQGVRAEGVIQPEVHCRSEYRMEYS